MGERGEWVVNKGWGRRGSLGGEEYQYGSFV